MGKFLAIFAATIALLASLPRPPIVEFSPECEDLSLRYIEVEFEIWVAALEQNEKSMAASIKRPILRDAIWSVCTTLEIEALTGAVVAAGERYHVATPLSRMLLALARALSDTPTRA